MLTFLFSCHVVDPSCTPHTYSTAVSLGRFDQLFHLHQTSIPRHLSLVCKITLARSSGDFGCWVECQEVEWDLYLSPVQKARHSLS